MLADGAKWGRSALAYVCSADRPDVIVTDSSSPPDQRAELADRGVHVHLT